MDSASPSTPRVPSVDALRGLVMIIMALDHIREFFHAGAMSFQPEDLTRTTIALFLTRWVTHICAPVFMFTAGLGAFFWWQRGRTLNQLSRLLWTRGLWLVLLELTAVRLAFSFGRGPLFVTVLWALGWSMVALALLVHLPIRVLAILSLAIIALHNLADPVQASWFGGAAWVWNVLHQPGLVRAGNMIVIVAYPLVPWIAVMAAGFCFGRVMISDGSSRRLFWIGLSLTAAFVVIRAINVYGDPRPWSGQVPGMTVLSFLRCNKYPPSLDFLLMTLGPAILLLAWFEHVRFTPRNPLIVFGRVPLFYFLVHLLAIHIAAVLFAWVRYGHAGFMLQPLPSLGGEAKLYPPDFGYPLWVVYAVWAGLVALLYPLCLWYGRLKARKRDSWLVYL